MSNFDKFVLHTYHSGVISFMTVRCHKGKIKAMFFGFCFLPSSSKRPVKNHSQTIPLWNLGVYPLVAIPLHRGAGGGVADLLLQ